MQQQGMQPPSMGMPPQPQGTMGAMPGMPPQGMGAQQGNMSLSVEMTANSAGMGDMMCGQAQMRNPGAMHPPAPDNTIPQPDVSGLAVPMGGMPGMNMGMQAPPQSGMYGMMGQPPMMNPDMSAMSAMSAAPQPRAMPMGAGQMGPQGNMASMHHQMASHGMHQQQHPSMMQHPCGPGLMQHPQRPQAPGGMMHSAPPSMMSAPSSAPAGMRMGGGMGPLGGGRGGLGRSSGGFSGEAGGSGTLPYAKFLEMQKRVVKAKNEGKGQSYMAAIIHEYAGYTFTCHEVQSMLSEFSDDSIKMSVVGDICDHGGVCDPQMANNVQARFRSESMGQAARKRIEDQRK
eukprot:gnl/Trimastix_PCT/3457.p1 GENE.gnl/Trimastix_PCT/3457~~gnl/Trimastix_PCT/3457.p1  ORF type:complete len:402 (-),score=64.75 gnl/Trimastix_PCT/3457:128-1156(-)